MHYHSLSSAVLCICTTSSEYIRTYKVVCEYILYIRSALQDVKMCLCRGRPAYGALKFVASSILHRVRAYMRFLLRNNTSNVRMM
jgi:hypothetical protein